MIAGSGLIRGARHNPAQAQPSGVQGTRCSDACQGSHASCMPAATDRSHGCCFNPDDMEVDLTQLERALQGREEQLSDKH
jgi:hypothetical protein